MKTYIEQLFENCGMNTPVEYLTEGASAKAPQYKVTSPEEFEMLVSQDPTYDSSVDDGKFIDWIFSLWRNFKTDKKNEEKYERAVAYKQEHPDAQLPPKPTKLSQDKLEDFEKIRDFLLVLKDNIKLINGNMSQFKSIADLASFVRGIKEKDISVDERAMKNYKVFREAMTDGLEVVYNGPNFIIGIPETYEASSHFKKPVTEWCTAYPDMYDEYLQEYGGKYYIHLNKHTGDLYQLHYESYQFKNASDMEIDKKKFISNYPELKTFYDKILPTDNYKWWVLHNKQPTEQEQLAAVKQNGDLIEFIENPSEEVQLAAVNKNGDAISYIKNPSEKVQLAAVKQDGDAIQFIENPSEKVQLAAVKQNGWAIKEIVNPSEEVQLAAVTEYGKAIRYIKNPSEEVQLTAVKQNGDLIEFIENPSEEMQLAAVKQDGWAIEYIKNPSKEVQLAAVKEDGRAIQFIKNPSEEIQLAAVKQNGYAIKYIKNPSKEVQLAAVEENGQAIEYIENPSEKVQLTAVEEDGYAIRYIKNPSEEVQLAAVKQNRYAIQFIKNPCKEAIELARKLGYNG